MKTGARNLGHVPDAHNVRDVRETYNIGDVRKKDVRRVKLEEKRKFRFVRV